MGRGDGSAGTAAAPAAAAAGKARPAVVNGRADADTRTSQQRLDIREECQRVSDAFLDHDRRLEAASREMQAALGSGRSGAPEKKSPQGKPSNPKPLDWEHDLGTVVLLRHVRADHLTPVAGSEKRFDFSERPRGGPSPRNVPRPGGRRGEGAADPEASTVDDIVRAMTQGLPSTPITPVAKTSRFEFPPEAVRSRRSSLRSATNAAAAAAPAPAATAAATAAAASPNGRVKDEPPSPQAKQKFTSAEPPTHGTTNSPAAPPSAWAPAVAEQENDNESISSPVDSNLCLDTPPEVDGDFFETLIKREEAVRPPGQSSPAKLQDESAADRLHTAPLPSTGNEPVVKKKEEGAAVVKEGAAVVVKEEAMVVKERPQAPESVVVTLRVPVPTQAMDVAVKEEPAATSTTAAATTAPARPVKAKASSGATTGQAAPAPKITKAEGRNGSAKQRKTPTRATPPKATPPGVSRTPPRDVRANRRGSGRRSSQGGEPPRDTRVESPARGRGRDRVRDRDRDKSRRASPRASPRVSPNNGRGDSRRAPEQGRSPAWHNPGPQGRRRSSREEEVDGSWARSAADSHGARRARSRSPPRRGSADRDPPRPRWSGLERERHTGPPRAHDSRRIDYNGASYGGAPPGSERGAERDRARDWDRERDRAGGRPLDRVVGPDRGRDREQDSSAEGERRDSSRHESSHGKDKGRGGRTEPDARSAATARKGSKRKGSLDGSETRGDGDRHKRRREDPSSPGRPETTKPPPPPPLNQRPSSSSTGGQKARPDKKQATAKHRRLTAAGKELKHKADRLKETEPEAAVNLYLQAANKFMLNVHAVVKGKTGPAVRSYEETIQFVEYVASYASTHSYKLQAALALRCIAVLCYQCFENLVENSPKKRLVEARETMSRAVQQSRPEATPPQPTPPQPPSGAQSPGTVSVPAATAQTAVGCVQAIEYFAKAKSRWAKARDMGHFEEFRIAQERFQIELRLSSSVETAGIYVQQVVTQLQKAEP